MMKSENSSKYLKKLEIKLASNYIRKSKIMKAFRKIWEFVVNRAYILLQTMILQYFLKSDMLNNCNHN